MPDRDDKPKSDWADELDMRKRISFRDYPSTGLVVLAALVSGMGWLAYKWSDRKRGSQVPSSDDSRRPKEAASKAPAPDEPKAAP